MAHVSKELCAAFFSTWVITSSLWEDALSEAMRIRPFFTGDPISSRAERPPMDLLGDPNSVVFLPGGDSASPDPHVFLERRGVPACALSIEIGA
jgi:hypothetical protein